MWLLEWSLWGEMCCGTCHVVLKGVLWCNCHSLTWLHASLQLGAKLSWSMQSGLSFEILHAFLLLLNANLSYPLSMHLTGSVKCAFPSSTTHSMVHTAVEGRGSRGDDVQLHPAVSC